MKTSYQEIVEARSKVWGHLMMKGHFFEALQFGISLEKLAIELKDDELVATAKLLIARSAKEIVEKNSTPTEELRANSHSCSFCGKNPPEIKLVAGSDAFICNECVTTVSEIFNEKS